MFYKVYCKNDESFLVLFIIWRIKTMYRIQTLTSIYYNSQDKFAKYLLIKHDKYATLCNKTIYAVNLLGYLFSIKMLSNETGKINVIIDYCDSVKCF